MLLAAGQYGSVALEAKDLRNIRKAKIIIEFGTGPDLAKFQAAMGFIDRGVFRGEKR
jgi:hypothetical protein